MKIKYVILLGLFFTIIDVFGQQTIDYGVRQTIYRNGIGLGSVIAVVASWERNKSILFAILHGILGWLYVIYYAITR